MKFKLIYSLFLLLYSSILFAQSHTLENEVYVSKLVMEINDLKELDQLNLEKVFSIFDNNTDLEKEIAFKLVVHLDTKMKDSSAILNDFTVNIKGSAKNKIVLQSRASKLITKLRKSIDELVID